MSTLDFHRLFKPCFEDLNETKGWFHFHPIFSKKELLVTFSMDQKKNRKSCKIKKRHPLS